MTRAENVLLLHFIKELGAYQSRAGCNDMPQEAFDISPPRLMKLKGDFDEWDRMANGRDEPTNIRHVQDFEWLGYLRALVERDLE